MIGSGLGGSVGLAAESTFGTYVAAARWLRVDSAPFDKVKNTVQGKGLSAGAFIPYGSDYVVTTQAAKGTIKMQLFDRQAGILLDQLMGGSAAPAQQAGGAAYLLSRPIVADLAGKTMSVQLGLPDTTGTVRPYTYLGCKIVSAEFECGVNENLTCSLELDARDVTEAQTLVAPTYLALQPFHFAQMGVKIGAAFGAETAVQGVKKVTLKFERPIAEDRFYANNGGLKSEQIGNDWGSITGTIEADFVDKSIFSDRFVSNTPASLVWEFLGSNIASGYPRTFRARVSQVFFTSDGKDLDNSDIVSGSWSFEGKFDGVNSPLTFEYQSVDTAV